MYCTYLQGVRSEDVTNLIRIHATLCPEDGRVIAETTRTRRITALSTLDPCAGGRRPGLRRPFGKKPSRFALMPPCHSPVRPVPTGYWPPRVLSICLFPVVLGTDSLSDARAPRLIRNSPCFSRVVRPPPGRLERIAVPCVVHMSYTHRNVTFVGRVRRSKQADARPTGTRPRPDGPPPPGINFSGKLHARRWAPGPLCPAPGSRRRSRLAGRALGGGRSVPAPLAMPTQKARTHLRVRRR